VWSMIINALLAILNPILAALGLGAGLPPIL
jgi:hypothetical protein